MPEFLNSAHQVGVAQVYQHLSQHGMISAPTLLKIWRHRGCFSFSRAMSTAGSRRLEGRVAIVTASTDGIGFSIARRLVEDGARVMVSSRKERNVARAVEELKGEGGVTVAGTVCHVGEAEQRKKLIEETISTFGKLDILVSNAAVNPVYGPILESPESAWDKIFDVNVKSAALLVKEAHPHLKASRNGSVVFVSSIAGFHPFPAVGLYSISKTALLGLTKALAAELGPDNIRVNCIAPGIIKTRFSSALWQNETLADEATKHVPLGRLGEPNDCAGTISFLCSDDAAYVTGETIVIAGGTMSRL